MAAQITQKVLKSVCSGEEELAPTRVADIRVIHQQLVEANARKAEELAKAGVETGLQKGRRSTSTHPGGDAT